MQRAESRAQMKPQRTTSTASTASSILNGSLLEGNSSTDVAQLPSRMDVVLEAETVHYRPMFSRARTDTIKEKITLTVQSRLGGGITLSGIFEAATTIYPICKVYPPNICTHDGGSRGPSSGELGTLFWMTHSIVVKLRGSLAMNWERWEGSLFFY